ncbi:uncharacterized protein [Physcomitrium patens]|uniref:uncharacterized protein n=1 Tax=Physcomitrium patens TaxID=3218 RepID=UPI003CCE328F
MLRSTRLFKAYAMWVVVGCAYQTLFAGGRKTVLFSSRYCYCTLPLPKRFWIGLSDIRILSKCFLAIATEYRTIICIGSRRRYLQLVNMHGVTSSRQNQISVNREGHHPYLERQSSWARWRT